MRFVKDDYSITWCLRTLQSCISEVVHILNEGFHLLANFAFTDFFMKRLQALDLIAGQCFTQHGNKGTIAGKKYRMGLLMLIAFLGSHIKANKRFSCTGHTSNEDDMLFSLPRRLFDQFLYALRGDREIPCPGIMSGYVFHGMSGVKALCRFNDSGCWLVGRRNPLIGINGCCIDIREGGAQ